MSVSTLPSSLKRLVAAGTVLLLGALFAACTITRIDVGHVGILVKIAGAERGTQAMTLKTGWIFYWPLTEQVVEFPVSVQNVILTKDPHEGNDPKDKTNEHGVDESITFSSAEGMVVGADVGFSFHIDPQQAPKLYARFRQTDMRSLAYGYMRNVIREAFQESASKMPIQDIYGTKKSEMLGKATDRVKTVLGSDGIVVDQLTINGALRLPQNVTDSINRATEATQAALAAENKVRQVKAEAEQAAAHAEGLAESARKQAQGEADALMIKTKAQADALTISSQAQAKANQTLNSSLSASVLQYKALDTWDGKLPTYNGSSAVPMIPVK